MTTWTRRDVDRWIDYSEQLAVVRIGKYWNVIDKTTGAQLGNTYETKTRAAMEADRRIERGDYR